MFGKLFGSLFGAKKKTYPVLTVEMFQPVENKITAAEAKRLYKDLMVQVGYYEDKKEAGWYADSLADAMKEREEALKTELEDLKSDDKNTKNEAKEELRELKAELKACKDEAERASLIEEIARIEREIAEDSYELKAAAEALAAFKACKREFLIDYINSELHGDDWKNTTRG